MRQPKEQSAMKPLKILFFVDGMHPSADEVVQAEMTTGQVCFRNARAVPAEGALEACDGVMGSVVPKRYAEAYPSAAEALAKRKTQLDALAATAGDSPATVAPVIPTGKPSDAQQTAQDDGAGSAAQEAPKVAPEGSAGSAWTAGK
jgi:hypothetical protein